MSCNINIYLNSKSIQCLLNCLAIYNNQSINSFYKCISCFTSQLCSAIYPTSSIRFRLFSRRHQSTLLRFLFTYQSNFIANSDVEPHRKQYMTQETTYYNRILYSKLNKNPNLLANLQSADALLQGLKQVTKSAIY